MQIVPAADVTAMRVADAADGSARAEVVVGGRRTGRQVGGAVLEAALRCDDRLLLFMTDDVPFEEALSVHLLDAQGRLLDSAWIGGPYTSGSFAALAIEAPDTVRFRFVGDTDWRVQVLAQPRLRLPLRADAPGVHRRAGFKRHFVISGRPQPARA